MMAATITAARLRGLLGVNTHMGWQDTTTWGVANQPNVLRAFLYSGISFFRDGAPQDWNGLFPVYDSLYRKHGIQLRGLVSTPNGASDIALYARLATQTPGMLLSIEGQNEYNGTDPGPPRAAQQALFNAVTSNPALKGVQVVSMTTTGAGTTRMMGNMAGMAHICCAHPYSGTNPPGGALVNGRNAIAAASPGMPFGFSEWGWSTTGNAWSTVSDADRARFVLMGWMDCAAMGAVFATYYELMNNGPATSTVNEDTFGLFTQDGTPTLAAVAIRNMMTLLADTKPPAPTLPLPAVTLSESSPQTLQVVKADGSEWLVLWNEILGAEVDVTLPGPVAALTLYDPIRGIQPVQTASNVASIRFNVPNYPVVLSIGAPAAIALPPANPAASPSGTFVVVPADGSISDGRGHRFTLVATAGRGMQIARDGVIDAPTQQVRLLAWLGGVLYQVNADGHGWSKTGDGAWTSVPNIPMAP